MTDEPKARKGRNPMFAYPRKPVGIAWMARRACTDADFMHPPGGRQGTVQARECRVICAGCPVRAECLEYAITPPLENQGIWGGASWLERQRIRSGRLDVADVWARGDALLAARQEADENVA